MTLSFIGLSAPEKDSNSRVTVLSHLPTWKDVSKAGSNHQNPFSVKPPVAKHGMDDVRRKFKLDETGSALFHRRLMKR